MRFISVVLFLLVSSLFGQSIPIGGVGTGSSTWTVTNNKALYSAGPGTSLALTAFTNPLTNGSVILLGTQNDTVLSTPVTITDTAGNSYTSLRKNQWTPGTADYFCASNTSMTASNVITFSATPTATTFLNAIEITNSSGPVTCGNIDKQSSGGGSSTGSTTIAMGNFTTTTNGDFIWGMIFTFACSTPLTAPGYTAIQSALTDFDLSFWQQQLIAANIGVNAFCANTGIPYDAISVAISP